MLPYPEETPRDIRYEQHSTYVTRESSGISGERLFINVLTDEIDS